MGPSRAPRSAQSRPQTRAVEEIRDLLAKAQAGDGVARARLVEANTALVASLARRFQPMTAEYEDYFQVGCIGLLKAIDGFDLSFPVRFSTYAVPVILGEMRQYARSRHPVRLGRTLHDTMRSVHKAAEELAQTLGRHPTVQELARRLAMEVEDVALALEGARPVTSLDDPLFPHDPDGPAVADILAETAHPGEEFHVDNVVLKEALAELAPWERRLLGLRFFADKPQAEVARLLGVSQAHVSRTERRVLRKFRDLLGS